MGRTPRDVTETELAILQFLWDTGPSTIRQVADVLYPRGGRAQYATVQKLLDRLEQDAWVMRTKAQPANIYRANVGRDELIGRRLQAVAETLCGGSMTPLLTHLVRGNRLSDAERNALRELIDEEGRR